MAFCESCEKLKENSPNFTVNGITDTECNSLKNNTGLNDKLTILHDNCEDLNDMLDCLIGGQADKLMAYDICDIKDYIEGLVKNMYNMYKAMICSDCGHWNKLQTVSYAGTATLWTDIPVSINGSDMDSKTPAFTKFYEKSNLPSNVLTHQNYNKITVNNTTNVPLIVNSTFQGALYSDQLLSATYIVVTRDGKSIGQTPFIAPNTFDQQVSGESFILDPGQSAVMSYYMQVGVQNNQFPPIFGGSGDITFVLDVETESPASQRSFFNVYVNSIVDSTTTT